MKYHAMYFVLFSILFCNCSKAGSQNESNKSYTYFRLLDGRWISEKELNNKRYLDTSLIQCTPSHSSIEISWQSEDGDWISYDRYQSVEPYFTREIRFAQFEGTIKVLKKHISSPLVISPLSRSLQNYEFLIRELTILTDIKEVPFFVPQCANEIFKN